MNNVHILYLASGAGHRFGENKLLYPLHGKPLYLHTLERLHAIVKQQKTYTLTVVSCYEKVRQTVQSIGITAVDSPRSKEGISHTIRAGLDALHTVSPDDFVLFVVADQPYLSQQSIQKLLSQAKQGTETACICFGECVGNPVLFSAAYIPELYQLQGDVGGRAVVKNHTCIYVQAQNELELQDIDTKQDISKNIL